MEIDATTGRLDGVPFVESPNRGGRLMPEAIVIHYTAGPSLTGAVATLTRPKSVKHPSPASAHTVTGPDGKVTQLVPFNRQAWHAGTSSWDGRPSLNKWSVGLELVNPGFLTRRADGQWETYWHQIVPEADVMVARHKHAGPASKPKGWRVYPEAQIAACYAQCAALCDTYPTIRLLLGHDDIAPKRKSDPGPAFPTAKLAAWLGLDTAPLTPTP